MIGDCFHFQQQSVHQIERGRRCTSKPKKYIYALLASVWFMLSSHPYCALEPEVLKRLQTPNFQKYILPKDNYDVFHTCFTLSSFDRSI
jgi:hypothetical protein